MVWNPFSSSKPMDDQTKAPSRSSRTLCWEKRDEFFECLDKNNIIDSLKKENKGLVKSHCSKEFKEYSQNCATSWIQYFQEKRLSDMKKAKIMEEMKENGAKLIQLD